MRCLWLRRSSWIAGQSGTARDCFDRDTFRHHFYELPGDCAQLYLRDPGGNLVEVDVLGASAIADEVRADMKGLADAQPQTEENLRATLFLGGERRVAKEGST